MRRATLLLSTSVALSTAFSPVSVIPSRYSTATALQSSVEVPVTIAGDNIDLTPSISDYVNEKVERTLGKLSSVSAVSHCDVYLTVNKNPKVEDGHTAEVVTSIKGTTFRVAESSADMYKSIDLVSNRLVSFHDKDR